MSPKDPGVSRCHPRGPRGCLGADPGTPQMFLGDPGVSPKDLGASVCPPGVPGCRPGAGDGQGSVTMTLRGGSEGLRGHPRDTTGGWGVLPGVPGDKKPPPYPPPPGAPHLQVSMYNELLVTVLHGRHYLQERGCHGGVPKGPQGVRGPPRGSLGGVLSPPTCRNLARASFSFMRPWATR